MLASLIKVVRPSPRLAKYEPHGPVIKTAVPGPESLALLNDYEGLSQDFRTVRFFADYEKSAGNYVVDADGNTLLDVYAQSNALPIGYNHPDYLSFLNNANIRSQLLHRTACSITPPSDFTHRLQSTLMPLAPPGLSEIFNSCGCGIGANENAMKAAFLWYYKNQYGAELTSEQLKSTMEGKAPGIPNYAILSLSGGYHGRSLGTLSVSSSSGIDKVDFPAFNWPHAPFPKLKYPLAASPDNRTTEAQALEETRKIFMNTKVPIVGLIIEPVQNEGTYFASRTYYQQLQSMAKEFKAAFIVDETNSGLGASGKLWAHELWGLKPDIMTFSKKAQVAGYFAKPEFRPTYAYQLMNTWCGDPLRLIMLQGVMRVISNGNLIENAETVGDYIVNGLDNIKSKKGKMSNIRGVGLQIAFDMPDKKSAWGLCKTLLSKGVHVGVAKENVIQLRPSLTFGRQHADILLDAIDASI